MNWKFRKALDSIESYKDTQPFKNEIEQSTSNIGQSNYGQSNFFKSSSHNHQHHDYNTLHMVIQ